MTNVISTVALLVAKAIGSDSPDEQRTAAKTAVDLIATHGLVITEHAPKSESDRIRELEKQLEAADKRNLELFMQVGKLASERTYWQNYAKSWEDADRERREGRAA